MHERLVKSNIVCGGLKDLISVLICWKKCLHFHTHPNVYLLQTPSLPIQTPPAHASNFPTPYPGLIGTLFFGD